MFQEFQISVTPLKDRDQYLVRTEIVAPEVPHTEEQVYWPVTEWLEQAQQLMNDPLTQLLQGNGRLQDHGLFLPKISTQTPPNLFSLGKQLYDALFQGHLRDSWLIAQAVAQSRKSILRLRLGLKGNRLNRLPWEALHISEIRDNHLGCRPLATGTDLIFSRYQRHSFFNNLTHLSKPTQSKFLRILMVIASPNDQESLELKQEAYHLQQELKYNSHSNLPVIDLDILEQPGREELTQALEQGQYQIFHYAGHSNLGNSGGDMYLVSPTTGLTETLYGDDLAGLLANNGIKFAIFNSCYGADTALDSDLDQDSDLTLNRNLAQAMLKRGIPAVLAMAAKIPDRVALNLTRLLYRHINQGYPIDFSLSRARQGLMSAYGSDQLYWALPILYLESKFDGVLIQRDPLDWNLPQVHQGEILDDPSFLNPEEQALLLTPHPVKNSDFIEQAEHIEQQIKPTQEIVEEPEDEYLIKDILDELLETESALQNILTNLAHPETVKPEENQEKSPPQNPIETEVISQKTLPSEVENNTFIQDATQRKPARKINSITPTKKFLKKPLLILGVTGFLTLLGTTTWLVNQTLISQREPKEIKIVAPEIPNLTPGSNHNILAQTETALVASVAIESFTQGNFNKAQPAVESLLDRNALSLADAALKSVPTKNLDDPEISFLRGRLAWQSVKTGNKDYDILDARRYWETAVKNQPDSILFLNALGFAYYAEGKFNEANQMWYNALDIMKKNNYYPPESLDTYAGLALGLRKIAEKQSGRQKQILLNNALELHQKVITIDPLNFQGDNLTKNWLWSEQAIQEWKTFLPSKITQS